LIQLPHALFAFSAASQAIAEVNGAFWAKSLEARLAKAYRWICLMFEAMHRCDSMLSAI